MRDAAVLRQMRRDFELFNSQMQQLKENDMLLIQSFLLKEKDLTAIADERGIQCAEMYSMCQKKFERMAHDAGAVYKLDKLCLVNTEVFEQYLESFRL